MDKKQIPAYREICIIRGSNGDLVKKCMPQLHSYFRGKYKLQFVIMEDINSVREVIENGKFLHALYIIDGAIKGGHTQELLTGLPKERCFIASEEKAYVEYAKNLGYPVSDHLFMADPQQTKVIEDILGLKRILVAFTKDEMNNPGRDVIDAISKEGKFCYHSPHTHTLTEVMCHMQSFDLYLLEGEIAANMDKKALRAISKKKLIVFNPDGIFMAKVLIPWGIQYEKTRPYSSSLKRLMPTFMNILNTN